jgi:simple sugar transport system ATP-binding protein
MDASDWAVEMHGIHKWFGAVHANRGVDLCVRRGSIHGIVGENGAGKSTLMSVLYGFHEADAGTLDIDGRRVRLTCAQDAMAHGIGMVHQHFMLVGCFSVLENIVLGAEPSGAFSQGMRQARVDIDALARQFGWSIDLDALARDLPVGVLQCVEILKALYRRANILILDEPTAVLTPQETQQLGGVLRQLKGQGKTILIITHKLKEIMAMTDEVTVMRDGAVVASCATHATHPAALAQWMVGRPLKSPPPAQVQVLPSSESVIEFGCVCLQTNGLTWRDSQGAVRLRDVCLTLRAGEILGVAGVSGNGQTELLLVLASLLTPASGTIRWTLPDADGGVTAERLIDRQHPCSPKDLRRWGVAHVPEDRHRHGLVLGFAAWESAVLGYVDDPALSRGGWLDPAAMRAQCRALMQGFDVRPVDENLPCAKFSGGNQQKLVLAREFSRAPRVLLIGQPTRGVDIGAIELIHAQVRALRDAGCAVLLVSSELDEILALSDRIAVMTAGRIVGEVARADATEHRLGEWMGACTA